MDQRKCILIVDDEWQIVSLLEKALAADRFEISAYTKSGDALDNFKINHFDVAIIDLMMPGLGGQKLFSEIKQQDPFVQTIIMTGYPSITMISELLAAGACDFIVKPFAVETVNRVVMQAIERADRWRDLRVLWHERQEHRGE